jgi:hypothetical protein
MGFTTGSRGKVPEKRKPVIREQNNDNNNGLVKMAHYMLQCQGTQSHPTAVIVLIDHSLHHIQLISIAWVVPNNPYKSQAKCNIL